MSHLVLARKYRPQSFADVVGQDIIVDTLRAAITKDKIAHAMLFTGSRGVGKTTIARLVAKALVCLDLKSSEPCGLCSQCQAIDQFSSLDVLEIDGASHTGVDDIRDLRDSARYQPASAKYKIFIIDEVHMLSISAFNALLKILEEPPAHVIFIFATTEAHKIPKTILSRCQRYDFKRVGVEVIFHTLKKIIKTEGFSCDDDGLRLIAELSDGGMRDALSMAEQVFSARHEYVDAEKVSRVLGVVSHQAINQVVFSILKKDVEPALAVIAQVYEAGLDLCQMMDAVGERFRLLSLCAHMRDFMKAQQIMPSLGKQDFLDAQVEDPGDLRRLFSMSLDALSQVASSKKPLFALELFVLRAALRPAIAEASTINFCLQKLDAILQNKPIPKEPGLIPQKKTVKNPTELFSLLVEKLNKTVPTLASHLRHARPEISLDGLAIILHFEVGIHHDEVKNHQEHPEFILALKECFGQKYELNFILEKSPDEHLKQIKTVAQSDVEKKQQAADALYERAKNNELIKSALEIFGGDICEVKRIATQSVV